MKKYLVLVGGMLLNFGFSSNASAQFVAVDDAFTTTTSNVALVVGNVLANDNLNNPSTLLTTPINAGPVTLSSTGDVTVQANLDPMCFTFSYTICIPGTVLCSTAICVVTVTPVPPVGPLTQTLPFNSTLANLVMNGQNILWYANPAAGRSITEVPLPLSTPLVNGATYYASQTVNGIESKERIPVTVTLSALATANYTFAQLTQHYDATTDQLLLDNATKLDEILVYALSGKNVLSGLVHANKASVSFASLAAGTYVVVLKANGQQHSFKVVK